MSRSRDVSAVQNNLGVAIPPAAAGKNAVINGGFDIWQRGTSIAGSTTAFSADRWQSYRGVAGSTFSRQSVNDSTNLPNIQYCARVQRDSGNTSTSSIFLWQNFESVNSIPFAGKTITISFYARAGANYSNSSNLLTITVNTGTGTDQNGLIGTFTGQVTAINQNPTLTTTWQRFSYSATLASTATQIGLGFGFIPTGTAGAADYYEITGVQLELGSTATPFSRTGGTIQGELAACQRYLPSIQTGNVEFASGFAYSTTKALYPVNFQVTPRVAPTGITVNSAGNFTVRKSDASQQTVTGLAFSTGGLNACCIEATVASGLTAGNGSNILNSGSGTILFTGCEL